MATLTLNPELFRYVGFAKPTFDDDDLNGDNAKDEYLATKMMNYWKLLSVPPLFCYNFRHVRKAAKNQTCTGGALDGHLWA